MKLTLGLVLLWLLAVSGLAKLASPPPKLLFRDIAGEAGIT